MPIIPRYDSIQGDVPVVRPEQMPAVPDITSFPEYDNAKNAGIVSAAAQHFTAQAMTRKVQQDEARDYLQAENLKSEFAIKLQQAQEDAKNSPAVPRKGVELGDASEEPSATTGFQPRSETVLPHYLEQQKALVAEIRKKAGTTGALQRLDVGIARITRVSQAQMQVHVGQLRDEELTAQTLDNVRMKAREIGTTPPPGATYGADGIPVLDPNQDATYSTMRAGVERAIDEAAAIGAVKPDVAAKMKLSELSRIDHGRATQTMLADPVAWLSASNTNNNGWAGRLTEEAYAKLDTRAHAILKQREDSQNSARLERQRQWEQDNFPRVRSDSTNPLTLSEIDDAVSKRRVITAEVGEKWRELVKNTRNGKWEDDGDLKVRMGLRAGAPDVTNKFLDEIDAVTRPGGLTLETALAYKDKAKAIIQHRDDKNLQQGFQAFHAAHTAGSTVLTTSPLLGPKMDQTSQTIKGNFQTALFENASRNGWETSAEWLKKNLPFYSKQLEDRVDSEIEVLSRALPDKLQVDPKIGDVTPEAIRTARQRAFKRYGIDPAKAATLDDSKLPEGLYRELETISHLSEFSDAKRDINRKNTQGAK